MKKLAIFALTVVAIGGASLAGTSAKAQGFGIGVGPGGVGVSVDDGYRRGYDRDYRRGREWRSSRNEVVVERRYRRDRDWDRPYRTKRVYIERD